MTREDILKDYCVNEHGIITSPGKFEGEMLYVPFYWDAMLSGCASESGEDPAWDEFEVLEDERRMFPELDGVARVRLEYSDSGFVYASTS